MGSIGMPELIVIMVIVLVIFGADKLPQIGEDLGKTIHTFRHSTRKEPIDPTSKEAKELSDKT